MPGRPKKRKSTVQSFETVPNPKKQVLLTTKKLTTVRDKHPAWSAPSMRQQSITQMDGLRDHYHPELENADLETDEEEADSYFASPTRNKRRKTTPEKPTRRIETRSAKRKAAQEDPPILEQENQPILPLAGKEAEAHTLRASMPTSMPPPKTPTSLRRREIPSSQSPADTPLSTQSRQSLRDYMRSPLKEKSTNIGLSVGSPGKGARQSKRLEVADSMESLDEDSPVAVRVGSTTEAVGLTAESQDITEEKPQLPSRAFAIHVDDFNQRLQAAQRPVQEIQNSSQARRRHEVIDSTDEEDDDEEAEAFNAGPETQAALASTEPSHKGLDRPSELTPITSKDSKDAENDPKLGLIRKDASQTPDPLNAPSPPTRESNLEDNLPMQRPKKVEFIDLASSDPPGPTTPSPPNERPSDSQEVSAQLFADLLRDTHSGGLQTETQYERGWKIYTPADEINSDPEPLPSTSQPIEQPLSSLMTVPTQMIRPPISSPPKFYKAPVPPSQATTVDLTQPSPRNAPPSSSQALLTQPSPHNQKESPLLQAAHSSSQAFPSSPPPVPPSSSSPLANRKADPWAGYVWNGVRLTESQLLPDSLMDDSLVGPPGLSQESWAEEL